MHMNIQYCGLVARLLYSVHWNVFNDNSTTTNNNIFKYLKLNLWYYRF